MEAVRLPTLRPDLRTALTRAVSHRGLADSKEGAPNVSQVRDVSQPTQHKPVLVNSDHVRTASESAPNVVTLVMDGGLHQNVEGNLKSVWAKLEEQRSVGEQKRSPFTSP